MGFFIPPEIRLRIWREALSPPRVLPMDICLDTAVALWHDEDRRQRGYAVFGGSFHLSKATDMSSVVGSINSLSLACTESRQVVVEMFPDILMAEETAGPALIMRQRGLRERFCRESSGNQARFMLRCNLKTDIFLFSDIDVNYWHVRSHEHFALTMYELFELAGESIERAQVFRQQLGDLGQVACPKTYLPCSSHSLAAMDCLHVLLAGMGSLDIFYLATEPLATHLNGFPADVQEIIRGRKELVDPVLRTVALRQFVDVVSATQPAKYSSISTLLAKINGEGKRRLGWSTWTPADDGRLRALPRVRILEIPTSKVGGLCDEPYNQLPWGR